MKRILAALVVVCAVVLSAGPAHAGWSSEKSDNSAGASGTEANTGTKPAENGGSADGSSALYQDPKPWTKHGYAPTCGANKEPGDAVMCGGAIYPCPDDGDIRYQDFTRKMGADNKPASGKDGEWKFVGMSVAAPMIHPRVVRR